MEGLLILGAGGHGKVVADIALDIGHWGRISFLDDRYPVNKSVLGLDVVGRIAEVKQFLSEFSQAVVAIGSNATRQQLLDELHQCGFSTPNLVHRRAFVSSSVKLSRGCVVMANAVVNAEADIGTGCIINTGATVDHDCALGDAVHVCPGVNLAGDVQIGARSWIGIGAIVIQRIKIGSDVTVGAGAVVTKDVPSCVTVVGVPAKVIKQSGKCS